VLVFGYIAPQPWENGSWFRIGLFGRVIEGYAVVYGWYGSLYSVALGPRDAYDNSLEVTELVGRAEGRTGVSQHRCVLLYNSCML
jgi:hypothetical protein